MRTFRIVCFFMLMLTSLSSFAGAETEKITVFVSIPPQAYFVERVGGESVDVEVLVNPGHSPATYEPTPKQVARLGRAAVFFRIGVPFEKGFMEKLADTHKNLSIVDIRKGVTLRQFREVELRNYKKAQGRQIPPDPHIWLDPEQAKIQAATICEALSRLAPESAPVFEENLQAFQADLDRIHQRMVTALSPYKGEKFYVYHPAFGYIADACGLIQVAVEIEGKEPTPKQLADLIELAKTDGAKVIFVQPQFAKKSAEAVANAIGGTVTSLDPLARNYFENLEKMTETLKAAFEER